MKQIIKLTRNHSNYPRLLNRLTFLLIIIGTLISTTIPVNAQYVPFIKITDDQFPQIKPAIDGNYIVYQDSRGGGLSDIYLFNRITKAEIALTSDPTVESKDPDISGNRVVWADNRDGNWEIYIYNVNTPGIDPQPLFVWEGDQIEPAIHGDVMVFTDKKPGNTSYNIYLYEFNTGLLSRLTDDTDGDQRVPDVYGNYVVWQDQRSGDWDIYMYRIDTAVETQLTEDPEVQSYPAIHGNRVVWQDYRNGNWDIYLHHITFGIGNAFENFDWPVYSQSIGQLNSKDQMHPAIYGDYVVWEDYRSNDWDLYLYTFINDLVGWPSLILDEDFDQKNAAMFEEFVVFQDERDNDGGSDIWQWERPPGVDVSLIVEDDPDLVITGGDLSYYVYIKNTGRQDADNVVVTCTLPDGVDLRYVTNSSGLGASILGNVVTCELGTMAPNDMDTLHIAVTPLDEAILSFSASVVTSDVDINPDNNTHSIKTEVIWNLSKLIGTGSNPSLQLGVDKSVHIVFLDETYGNYLYYSNNINGIWSRETLVEDQNNSMMEAQMILDNQGLVHVVYSTLSGSLWYMKKTESSWSTPVKLAQSNNIIAGISIGCSPEGIIYVSYLKSVWGDNINLHYNNGSWIGPVILETEPSSRAYNDLEMTVDKEGYLHFTYYLVGAPEQGPHYITNAPDSVWKAPVLIEDGWEGSQMESLRLSITTDENNQPHVSYSGSENDDYEENFKYATKVGGTWNSQFVYDHQFSAFSTITTGRLQEPHICFLDQNANELIYAYKSGGSWEYKTVAYETDEVCGVEVDDDGFVHIVFSHYDSDKHETVMKYVTNMPESPKPKISITPESLDFWKFVVGDTTEAKQVIIKNIGDAILQISDISTVWRDSIHFAVTKNTCSNLNPSDTCSVFIAFSPQSFGEKKALLQVESNDPANPTESVLLEGEGLAPQVWDYGSLAFGDVNVGDSAINAYTIKNKGNTNLQIQMVVIQEDDATDFFYTDLPDTPFNIAENDSIVFNIVFKPGSTGDKTSILRIFTNDLDLTRVLNGIGTTPSFSIEGVVVTPEGDLVNEGTIFVYAIENGESQAKVRWKPLEGASAYSFNEVPKNTVTLWFIPDISQYPGYLTTYLGNNALFAEADFFLLDKDTAGLKITLIQAPPPPNGNSEISGIFVEEDGNKSGSTLTYGIYNGSGTPVSETSVYLIDQSSTIFDFDVTKSTGEFVFENIPVGTYKFVADYVGFSMDDSNDSLVVEQENQKYKIAAIANNKLITIEVENVTAISSLNESGRIYIYPNPADDQIILQFEEAFNPGPYTLKINSIGGQLVKSSKIEFRDHAQEFIIPIDDLSPGLYVITITGNTSIYRASFIKVE